MRGTDELTVPGPNGTTVTQNINLAHGRGWTMALRARHFKRAAARRASRLTSRGVRVDLRCLPNAGYNQLQVENDTMLHALKHLLFRLFGYRPGHNPSSGSTRDPYAWKPAPRKPQPKGRSGSVAVVEPDDQ